MIKIETITVENPFNGNSTEFVIIDHGNDQFTSMPKAIYDEQQAAQAEHLNGILPGDA